MNEMMKRKDKNVVSGVDPTFKKNLGVICLANFIVITGFSIMSPFFPIYASNILNEVIVLGVKMGVASQIGILVAGYTFMLFLTAPAFGRLSDNTPAGRKPLIVIGQFMYAILMIGFGAAANFWSLLVIRMLQGMASSAVWPVGQAMIVEGSSSESKGKNLGNFAFSINAGLALGPFIGSLIYWIFNTHIGMHEIEALRTTFYLIGGICFFVAFSTAITLKELKQNTTPALAQSQLNSNSNPNDIENLPNSSASPMKNSPVEHYYRTLKEMLSAAIRSPKILYTSLKYSGEYRNKNNYILYLAALAYGFAFAAVLPLVSLLLVDNYFVDNTSLAFLVGIIGVVAMFGAPIGGKMSDKQEKGVALIYIGLTCSALMILTAFSTILGIVGIIIIFSLQRITIAAYQPAMDSLVGSLTPKSHLGKEFGMMQASFNLGGVLGPIIGGYLYDIYGSLSIPGIGKLNFVGFGIPFIVAGLLILTATAFIRKIKNQRV
jgi:MFS transporter, DHA1 family, multidrug resistance protein